MMNFQRLEWIEIYKIVIHVARKREVGIRVIKNSTSPRLKGPPLVRIESLDNRRGASPRKSARRVRFSCRAQKIHSIRCTLPHLISTILSTSLVPTD